jgi:hypothetical protein
MRALGIGGMIWEGLEQYPTLNEALQALERALAEWMQAQGFQGGARHGSQPSRRWDQHR